MYDYDKVDDLPDGQEDLISALQESIDFFKYLQTIVSLDPKLEQMFSDSIKNIVSSIETIKGLDVFQLQSLVLNMEKDLHNKKF